MKEDLTNRPNTCPACSASVPIIWGKGGITGSGIWSGKYGSGPSVATICSKCGAKLDAFTTDDKLETGPFFWQEHEDSN
jgi:hypothetical protein